MYRYIRVNSYIYSCGIVHLQRIRIFDSVTNERAVHTFNVEAGTQFVIAVSAVGKEVIELFRKVH